jgi:UDP-glucose 4-epimerase
MSIHLPVKQDLASPRSAPNGMAALPRAMKPKHRLLAWVFTRRNVLSKVLDGLELFMKASKMPVLGRLHPFLRPDNNHFTNLPVKVDIPAESVALPPEIAKALIRKSKYHHVLNKCLCRHGRDCKNHTHDIGCIFLGETGFDVTPGFSRRITMEEALEHLDKALANGLTPSTGRYRVDNYAFLVPDHKTLLGVCFCCNCCCFLSYYRHMPEDRVKAIYPHLPGLEITVTDNCKGCGSCAERCYMKAIHIENGKAVHDDICRGCGRCVRICKNGGVEARIIDPKYFEKTVEKFTSLAKLV